MLTRSFRWFSLCLLLAVVCLLLGAAATAAAAEGGLVAWYPFDEGTGSVAHDKSGHGLDAKIVGAQWVKLDQGFALRFDGVEDLVECGSSPALNLSGDVTVVACVKPTSFDGRDKLIFGDSAGLSVNRNLNIEVDRNIIFCEHGNDAQTDQFTAGIALNQWQELAFVFEYPKCYLYVNGKEVQSRDMAFPITATHGGAKFIGGWWAGHFAGEISEVRIYRKALSESAVASLYEGKPVTSALRAQVTPIIEYSLGRLRVEIAAQNVSAAGLRTEVKVLSPGQERPLYEGSASLTETRPRSGRAMGVVELETKNLTPGAYSVEATVCGADGIVLTRGQAGIAWPEKPFWFGSKAGITEDVLPPYTPIKMTRDDAGISVDVTERRYTLAAGPLLSQVESHGAPLFAGPFRVQAMIDGAEVGFAPAPPQVVHESPAAVSIVQRLTADAAQLTIESRLEYDGFLKTTWRLTPKGPASIQRLRLEIPLRAECAKYIYCWPLEHFVKEFRPGLLKEDLSSFFKPIVWLGDDARGFSWFCESDQNWTPAESPTAIQVVRTAAEVYLRLNFIQAPLAVKPEAPLTYTFAFQATPVKPITKDGWDYRIVSCPWYGHDYDMLKKPIEGKPALKYYADLGARTLLVDNWTSVMTYPLPMALSAECKAMADECHRYGIKLMPYLGFQVSDQAPEYAAFKREVIKLPENTSSDQYPDMTPQNVSTVCLKGVWQDALVAGVARLMDEYGVDGIYLDSTCSPWGCTNELHGCGYRRPDGRLRPTYPVFAVRDAFKRLYTVVRRRKPDGVMDAHVYDCMNISALAFATSYWNGEQLGNPAFLPDGLPLDRFRTEFMGINWGVPADFLYYKLGDYRKCYALSLLHDVLIRPNDADQFALEASIGKLADEFGRKEARWLPYWSNAEYVRVSPVDCYVSLYRHPTHGVLAVVSNLGKNAAAATVTLDLKKLDLPAKLTAVDGLTRTPVTIRDGRIEHSLASVGWAIIWIKPGQEF
jgi:hypothetical protein